MGKLLAPERLRKNIISSIRQEERRRAKLFLLIFLGVALFSSYGIIYSFQFLIGEFQKSSFYSYISLFLSDTDIALAYWQDLLLMLIETLPFFGITLTLAAIGILLTSLRALTGNSLHRFKPTFIN